MSTQTYEKVNSIELVSLCYNVEIVLDKYAKGAKVTFEGIADLEDIKISSFKGMIRIEQTAWQRDAPGDAGRSKHPLNGVAFFEMSPFQTPQQKKVKKKTFSESIFRNFFKKDTISQLPSGPVAHITIVTGPAEMYVRDCISIVGSIQGDLSGDIHGSGYLNLDGAKEVALSVRGNSKVRLQKVDSIKIDAHNSANVRVTDTLKGGLVAAYDTSMVTLRGATFDKLLVRSTRDADIRIIGNVTNSSFILHEHSTIHVDGNVEKSDITAYESTKIFLSEGPSDNCIVTHPLASVVS